MNDLESLKPILKQLGASHVKRGILKEHYPVVMGAIMKTLKENLGGLWTPEVEKSWQTFLDFVSMEMISDNYGKLTYVTTANVKDVQDTWAIAKTLGYFTVGDSVFVNMF